MLEYQKRLQRELNAVSSAALDNLTYVPMGAIEMPRRVYGLSEILGFICMAAAVGVTIGFCLAMMFLR